VSNSDTVKVALSLSLYLASSLCCQQLLLLIITLIGKVPFNDTVTKTATDLFSLLTALLLLFFLLL